MNEFVSGALAAAYLVAALHFVLFWSRTDDRLFAAFGIAFAMLAAQRTALTILALDPDAAVWLYAVRALAFLLIAYAIVDKNRARPPA